MSLLIPKRQLIRDREYLNAMRDFDCVISGSSPCDPAHIRYGLQGGIGLKPPDDHALPLAPALHAAQHQTGEIRFWRQSVTDDLLMRALVALAEKIYAEWKRLE